MRSDAGLAFAIEWFPHFVDAVRADGAWYAEMMTDSARENLLNSVTAQHMRQYGRRSMGELFWARCEWELVDISFGLAKQRFAWTPKAWNEQWDDGSAGDLGVIEAKLVYDHLPQRGQVERMGAQLAATVERHGRERVGATLGLIWFLSYGAAAPAQTLDAELARQSFVPVAGGVVDVGVVDTGAVWPIANGVLARLHVGLFHWNGKP